MGKIVVALIVASVSVLAAIAGAQARTQDTGGAIASANGYWFENGAFVAGTRYVVDGRFIDAAPAGISRTIDLGGRFVVPPFGEAHNHNTSKARLERYFSQGIFYVKNPNSFPDDRARAGGLINTPSTPDVVFAGGGLTSPGGHPISIIDRGISRGTMTEKDGEGAFYHGIADRVDLGRRWPEILAGKPDFIKVYLLYSEAFAMRRNDPKARGWRGLDPALLPEVVNRARAAGLRVSAHVESAADFELAVDAGVDEVNHLPGFRGPAPGMTVTPQLFDISDALAKRAAAQKTIVVTTVSGAEGLPKEDPLRKLVEAQTVKSLRRLHEAGVPIAIGSDRYEFTSRDEARYLRTLGVFDNATLLRLWCENTVATIFPKRHVGKIESGAEANFVVLDGNPIEDFDAVTRISMRIKQGVVAEPMTTGGTSAR
jgi:imidazolonepropionase-like amidohydrolase